jgi:hypothetical protein
MLYTSSVLPNIGTQFSKHCELYRRKQKISWDLPYKNIRKIETLLRNMLNIAENVLILN